MAETGAETILVVEDNPVTRKLLRVTLEAEGYVVVEASDGRTALSVFRDRLPDLVLQDLVLPDSDGLELVRQLRQQPGAAALPIVALTGFAARAADASLDASGFTAMIQKPVETVRLVESIRALLPGTRARSARLGEGRHLLVVDDDPVQLKLTRLQLGQLGFEVTTASNGTEALRLAQETPPDLILSDALMPGMDGFQLALEMRRRPGLGRVPLVLQTAHYRADTDQELARQVGANALLLRSANAEDLVPTLLEAIRSGPPSTVKEPSDRLELEHAQTVIRQLDRQLEMSSGLALRCMLQAAQLSLLGGMAEALARRGGEEVALGDVLAAALDAAGISKGALYLMSPGRGLVLRELIGFPPADRAQVATFFGQLPLLEQIIEGRGAVTIPSAAVPEAVGKAILAQAGIAIAEIVPLVSDGRGMGAIVLGSRGTDLKSQDSVAFTRAIGNQMVLSLELESSFKRLARSEQRYRMLMETASDAIAILGPDGVVFEANPRWEEILGLPEDKIVGRRLSEFVTPGSGLDLNHLLHDGGPRRPVEITKPNGTIILMELSGTRAVVGGDDLVFCIGHDVTDRVRAHAQLMVSDRMASIGSLAAAVAHEINNPLAVVIANLELAERDLGMLARKIAQAPPDVGELEFDIQEAYEAAERVRTIVRDLKIFSRAEEDTHARVDLHRVLDSSARMAWNEIRHRARLFKEYGPLPLVLANESRLGQVFLNLIINAAQAIPEGQADTNSIKVRTFTDERGRAVAEIIDSGTGMPADTKNKLFTPFFTTKPKGVGTGLGLAICHRIITALSGEISVDSELGRGTTFRVAIPPATGVVAEQPTEKAPVPGAARRGRLLVVDDEKSIGSAVSRLLGPEHDTAVAEDAQSAYQRIAGGERFDLILCDLMMPVMTGMDLHAALVRAAPDQAEKMVFLTGGAFTPRARGFLNEVENPRFEKPFDLNMLRTLINQRLR